jgi:hypothetical protein
MPPGIHDLVIPAKTGTAWQWTGECVMGFDEVIMHRNILQREITCRKRAFSCGTGRLAG